MGFSVDELVSITRTAIDAAFCDEDLRAELRSRVQPSCS